MSYIPPTLRCPTPSALIRLRWDAPALRAIGDRAVYELLVEIGLAHGCLDDIAERVANYRQLKPEMLVATGGDRFPPHLREVPR